MKQMGFSVDGTRLFPGLHTKAAFCLLNTFHPIYPGSFLAISGDDDELIPEARHDQLASVRKMPTRLHIFAAICTPE